MSDTNFNLWIVEDQRPLRERLASMIDASPDINCKHTFGSYDEMLPHIRANKFPHILIVDIQLPGINGIEIIRRIRSLHPATQFIVFTISEDRHTVFDAICAGASGYLVKNAPFAEILNGIQLVRDGGSPLSGSIASMILDTYKLPAHNRPESELSDQEIEILNLLAAGMMKKEISSKISLSSSAVDYHLRAIYRKLQVHSQAGAVAEAFRKGLIK